MTNIIPETVGTPFYTLRVNGHDLVVDGSKKGQPGDVVVVWPVKGGPLVARRLARCSPYNQYFFQTLAERRTLTRHQLAPLARRGPIFGFRCVKICGEYGKRPMPGTKYIPFQLKFP